MEISQGCLTLIEAAVRGEVFRWYCFVVLLEDLVLFKDLFFHYWAFLFFL